MRQINWVVVFPYLLGAIAGAVVAWHLAGADARAEARAAERVHAEACATAGGVPLAADGRVLCFDPRVVRVLEGS